MHAQSSTAAQAGQIALRARLFVPKRAKVFGAGNPRPMTPGAKRRVKESAQRKGMTVHTMAVLEVLLFKFHNSATGHCYPSYERIAKEARVGRSTVFKAIKALEAAGVMKWVNRLKWKVIQGQFGPVRVPSRSSNAYEFVDPGPEFAARTVITPSFLNSLLRVASDFEKMAKIDTNDPLERLLRRVHATAEARRRE
jgi:Helix-turn-helix domain